MASQMRLYQVKEGRLEAFMQGWLAGVPRLRRAHGFSIDGAWLDEEQRRFVWLLSFPGDRTTFEEAEQRYHDSPERMALIPNPGGELEASQQWFVEPVDPDHRTNRRDPRDGDR